MRGVPRWATRKSGTEALAAAKNRSLPTAANMKMQNTNKHNR